MYYTGTIMSSMLNFPAAQAIWLNALTAGFNSSFGLLGVYFSSRFPRRWVTLGSLTGVSISLALIVGAFFAQWSKAVVIGFCLYLGCFASGMGPLPWLINSEIYSNDSRHYAGWATSVNWVTNYVVAATFLSSADSIGVGSTFLGYLVVALVGLVVLYFFLPETRDITIQDL